MAAGRRRRIARRTAIIATVVVLSLAMEISGFLATPADLRPEVSYTTLHAAVPIVFAACAGIAWAIGPNDVPARLMIAFVVMWIPQSFYQVIEQVGWLWPILRGIDLTWAVIAGILVLVYPRGWLGDRFDRFIATTALVASLVNFLAVLALAGTDAVPCDCVPNPYRIAEAPGLFALIDTGYRIVGGALALAIAVRLLVRWVRGSVPARTVAFLMPVALMAWATTLAVQAVGYAAGAPPTWSSTRCRSSRWPRCPSASSRASRTRATCGRAWPTSCASRARAPTAASGPSRSRARSATTACASTGGTRSAAGTSMPRGSPSTRRRPVGATASSPSRRRADCRSR
ncbi:hypothetical protein ACFPER_00690 [Agromyces aurantiacus]|uniref:Uncharacterized protein n=1 Tax=Agromyces aurantiacus TaxID=165814 RepID=A0ABV9R1H9_9MICO|nr:hypothetical protein [Agromyces aurantiacus]MBM7505600.1 hypothetical protein [Agromyces aurantiacus]